MFDMMATIRNIKNNIDKLKMKIATNNNKYILLDRNKNPTGMADNISCEYSSLNMKVLMSHIGEKMASRLKAPLITKPYKVELKSKVSTQEDLESPWSRYWVNEIGSDFWYHRKNWEQSYVMQVLYNNDMMRKGKKGLGLGCGQERLPSYLIKRGCNITAGDKPDTASSKSWVDSGQYTQSLNDLYHKDIIDYDTFTKNIKLKYVDMNDLPPELSEKYDFCWSICAIEHLGSIEKGIAFLNNSLKLLKPGGISIHTTEYNYLNVATTLDNWPSVIFSKEDFINLRNSIHKYGGKIDDFDFNYGEMIFDQYIDCPPYFHHFIKGININPPLLRVPHIKLNIDGFPATCFGIIIRKL